MKRITLFHVKVTFKLQKEKKNSTIKTAKVHKIHALYSELSEAIESNLSCLLLFGKEQLSQHSTFWKRETSPYVFHRRKKEGLE